MKVSFSKIRVYNFLAYYLFALLSGIISFLSVSYLSKEISPSEYGMLGLYSSILFFTPSLLTFSCNGLQAIEIVKLKESDYVSFRNALLTFASIVTMIFFIIALPVILVFPSYSLVISAALIMGYLQVLIGIHNTELFNFGRAKHYGVLTVSSAAFTLGLTYVFLTQWKCEWHYRLLSLVLVEFLFVIVRFKYFSDILVKFRLVIDKDQYRDFIRYGLPLMGSVFAGWFISQSDRYFLLVYFSLEQVGYYAAAAGISSVITLLNSNLIKVIYPEFYRIFHDSGDMKRLYKTALAYILFISLVIGCFNFLVSEFGGYILGEEFGESLGIIRFMAVSHGLFGLYQILTLRIDYEKLNNFKVFSVVISGVVVVFCTILGIPYFGYKAPAIATLVSYIVLVIVTFMYNIYRFNENNVEEMGD